MRTALALTILLLTATAAQAQPVQIANIYNGKDHQPTAGTAPPPPAQAERQSRDLSTMNTQLQQNAQQGAAAPEVGRNVYGTQQGGVVQITPPTSGSGVTK